MSQSLIHQVLDSHVDKGLSPQEAIKGSQSLIHQVLDSHLLVDQSQSAEDAVSQSLIHQVLDSHFEFKEECKNYQNLSRNPLFIRS